jgi:hypothetical protein
MNFDKLMKSDWAKNTSIAEVAEALSDRTESAGSVCEDRGFVLCAPVANILESRMKKHGLNADQYLWQLMKKHDL